LAIEARRERREFGSIQRSSGSSDRCICWLCFNTARRELVETGAYAFVRHPIYGGLILAAFGWAIVQASVLTVALAVVLAAFFRVKSAREEVWLQQRFPAYAGYRARTRRLFPWPGRSRG